MQPDTNNNSNTKETGATETLETRDGRVAVETVLTDNDAWQLLRDSLASSNSFANALCAKRSRYGGWTQNQRVWAHKLAMEARYGSRKTEKSEKSEQATPGDFSPIAALFTRASSRLRYPRITFEFEDQPIVLQRAGRRSKYTGQIHVSDGGPYKRGTYFGRIDTAGAFHPARRCPEAVIQFLKLFARDPAGFVTTYGRSSGRRCFCRQQLTDASSLAAGMGPVCATNYGLEQAWKEATREKERGRDEDFV